MLPQPTYDEPLELILKLVGETCNIDCQYCYEKRKPYDKARYLDPALLKQFLESIGPRPVLVHLHGGEPLLYGMRRMAEIFRVLREYKGSVSLAIQTNGTLLTNDWLDFFALEWPTIEMGFSLDGLGELNMNRLDYKGRETFSSVLSALHLAEKRNLSVGVISVVTKASLGREEQILNDISSLPSVRALNFAPCFDYNVGRQKNAGISIIPTVASDAKPNWAIMPLEFSAFLATCFDLWIDKGHFRRFTIEPFMSLIRKIYGKNPGSCHFSEKKCAHSLTLYPDGSYGTCDEIELPLGALGKVGVPFHASWTQNSELMKKTESVLSKCDSCAYQKLCGGGCLATRMRYSGTRYDEEYCIYRTQIIDLVKKRVDAIPL